MDRLVLWSVVHVGESPSRSGYGVELKETFAVYGVWLTLMFPIREVSGSNFGPETAISTVFSLFSAPAGNGG